MTCTESESDSPTPQQGSAASRDQMRVPAEHEPWICLLGAIFLAAAGLALYGWRAAGVIAIVALSALLSALIWRAIGRRGANIQLPEILWYSVLLAMMLPPHLLTSHGADPLAAIPALWTILPAAGLLLVILIWLFGCDLASRAHPAVLAYLILAAIFSAALAPRVVLHRTRIFSGHLMQFVPTESGPRQGGDEGWISLRSTPPTDALYHGRSAAEQLSQYTRGGDGDRRSWLSLDGLLRDAMPPLEDLVIGGHPGPIGSSSLIAVLIGGLFLIYRGTIDYRIPLYTVLGAYAAILLLPVPIAISEGHVPWLPMVLPRAQLDWRVIITFANYELMASPLFLVAFFVATSRSIRPWRGRELIAYGLLLGIAAAALQLYVSCALGPYLALLVVGFIVRWRDRRAVDLAV